MRTLEKHGGKSEVNWLLRMFATRVFLVFDHDSVNGLWWFYGSFKWITQGEERDQNGSGCCSWTLLASSQTCGLRVFWIVYAAVEQYNWAKRIISGGAEPSWTFNYTATCSKSACEWSFPSSSWILSSSSLFLRFYCDTLLHSSLKEITPQEPTGQSNRLKLEVYSCPAP